MNDKGRDYNEYDLKVSDFCTTPAPSRTQVKDLISTMIRDDKIPPLEAVIRKVASLESSLDQRSPVFQVVSKKLGSVDSTSESISIGQDVEAQIVVGDNDSGLGQDLREKSKITKNVKLELQAGFVAAEHQEKVNHSQSKKSIKESRVKNPFYESPTKSREEVNHYHKSIEKSRVKNPFYESPTKSNTCRDKAHHKTITSPSGAISYECSGHHGSNEGTKDWIHCCNVPRFVNNEKELKFTKKKLSTTKSIKEKWILSRNESMVPCKLSSKTVNSSEVAGNHKLKHDNTRVKDPKIRISRTIRNLVTHFDGNEKTICFCKMCGKNYPGKQSLAKHIARAHNAKSTVSCPENCGKKLTSTYAIKKHLLSHRPRSEWPVACPLCGRRFQARADIPKHLQTAMHKDHNLPEVGSADWLALVYWDRPDLLRRKTGNI